MATGATSRLVEVLTEVRALLARPDNDFFWSSWQSSEHALREVDGLLKCLESGQIPPRAEMELLFLPTGPIQEVSLSSGWGDEFLRLAERFDSAIAEL